MRVRFPLPAPFLVFLPLALVACGENGERSGPSPATVSSQNAGTVEAAEKAQPAERDAVIPAPEPAVPATDGSPSCDIPIAPPSPEAAIRAYYQAIEEGDFAAAYCLWNGRGEASGQSYSDFREGFAATRDVRVEITGAIRTEGAAGSLYATVPVEVRATLKNGTPQRYAGDYVLQRANDVPGATAEQLAWRIYSATLQRR